METVITRKRIAMIAALTLASIFAFVALAAVSHAEFVNSKDCKLTVYGNRALYLVGPRVRTEIKLKDGINMEKAAVDLIAGDWSEFKEKYVVDDGKKIDQKHIDTLINRLSRTELVNEIAYGGERLNPVRLSCKICEDGECGRINLDVRLTVTKLYDTN